LRISVVFVDLEWSNTNLVLSLDPCCTLIESSTSILG